MTTLRQYDAINRLVSISHQTNGGVVVSSHAYAYNSANQRHTVTNADQSYWVYQYDDLGQVTSGKRYWPDATPMAGQQFEYQFDDIGNRLQSRRGGNGSGQNLRTTDYGPNALNQYTSITDPGYRDVIGRATRTIPVTVNGQTAERKSEYFWGEVSADNTSGPVWQEVTISGGTNLTGHLLVPPRSQSPVYDADGNLTSDGLWTYTWDGENRLIGMESQATVAAEARKRLTFSYDHQGRRIRKYVESVSGLQPPVTVLFVYDGWNLIAELSSELSPLSSLLWGLDLSGTPQGAGGVGGLLSVAYAQSPSSSHFVCYDGNGNVVAMVNAADGKASAQYEYGPFGEMIRATGPMAQTNIFRWSTKYTDDETDLVYYGYRYYSPAVGRWPSRDPLAELGGMNLYSFVYNNPLTYWDYLGNDPQSNLDLLKEKLGDEAYDATMCKQFANTATTVLNETPIGQAKIAITGKGLTDKQVSIAEQAAAAAGFIPWEKAIQLAGKGVRCCKRVVVCAKFKYRLRKVDKRLPDWTVSPGRKAGSTRYVDPANPQGNRVRVDRGNPESPFPGR